MPSRQTEVVQLAAVVVAACKAQGIKLAFAESLTGGLLSSAIVSVAGASEVFLGSIVAYQPALKASLLQVNQQQLAEQGAVTAAVAAQMALGAKARLASDLGLDPDAVVALATTGNAGPTADEFAPVGRVYVGLAGSSLTNGVQVFEFDLSGSRNEIREEAVYYALIKLREHLGI